MIFKLICAAFLFGLCSSFVLRPNPDNGKEEINGYYQTYEDYLSHKLQKMDEAVGTMHKMNAVYIRFKKDGQKENVKCSEMWGFMFKGHLFRIDHNKYSDDPCVVVSTGKIAYYENGSAYIDVLLNDSQTEMHPPGHLFYFSQDLNSPMIPVVTNKEYKEFGARFRATNKKLFDCLDKRPNKYNYRDCVIEYNKTEVKNSEKE